MLCTVRVGSIGITMDPQAFNMREALQTYLQIAGLVAGIVASVASIYSVFRVRALHVIVNSRLTELLQTTGRSERAEGKAEGLAEGRQEPR